MIPENFIAAVDVFEAAFPQGPPSDSGSVDAAEVVGRMTGLDMTRYELVQALNMCGWYLVRRA